MNAFRDREGLISHTDYWQSSACQQGIPYLLVQDREWHLLYPPINPRPQGRAFILPITRRGRPRGWWCWKLELTSVKLYIAQDHFIGPPVPLPAPGTRRTDHYLHLYGPMQSKENTGFFCRLPLTFMRITPARRVT